MLTVAMWPIDRPRPYAANPRKNAGAVTKVAASLREYGFRQPIVVDEAGIVIAGHTRLMAAKSLGMTEVPVHAASGLTRGASSSRRVLDTLGATLAPGYQLRYLKPLRDDVLERLTVPVLPFGVIAAAGAGMYLGIPRAGSIAGDAAPDQGE